MAERTRAGHDYIPAFGFDTLLPLYDGFTRVLGARRVHRRLLEQAGSLDGRTVLEIGCGTGNLTIPLKKAYPTAEVVGSDPDPLALARAADKAGSLDIRFDRGYAQRLPYPDGSFDAVLSALMLHHLQHLNDTALGEGLREVHRVLRPGGYLHVADIRPVAPEIFTEAGFAEPVTTGTVGTLFGRTYLQRARREPA